MCLACAGTVGVATQWLAAMNGRHHVAAPLFPLCRCDIDPRHDRHDVVRFRQRDWEEPIQDLQVMDWLPDRISARQQQRC
jgi:hypothetical protein